MKLIIEIPEEDRKDICNIHFVREDLKFKIGKSIMNGTPLPKGHGRLIDADVLVDGMEDDYEFCEVVNATPTIIESDKR